MFTVIKLGGVNGSGKTSVAKALIKLTNAEESRMSLVSGKPTKVYLGEVEGVPIQILGKYDTACGGMDSISDKDDRFALVEASAMPGNITFFEGLITGKTYGALGALSEQHVKRKAGRWLYAFMDTPFDVAAERVRQRRLAAGNDAPFDPERTMRSTFNSCEHLLEKLRGERQAKIGPQPYPHPTILLNHKRKPATLAKNLLDRALEIHREGF